MPWCTTCDRFLSPSTVHADGTCPACGRPVDAGRAHPFASPPTPAPVREGIDEHGETGFEVRSVTAATEGDADEAPPLPWHLWLLLACLAVYLGYRAFQGLEWLFGF